MGLDVRVCAAVLLATQAAAAPPSPLPERAESESERFVLEVVAEGLQVPSAIEFLPDGRALIAERGAGRVGLLDVRSGTLSPLEGLPALLVEEEAGVHDVALHPDFATNGQVYVAVTVGKRHRSTTAVVRARVRGSRFEEAQRLFTADAWSEDRFHYGGKLAFLGGHLFLTVGDRHWPDRAQDLSNHAGKILRLRDDGGVPADNPFAGDSNARPEIWSYGHRNPQGLAVRPGTDELWSNEHGPLGGDELNLIRRGANYGWPVVSFGWQYSGGPIGKGIVTEKGIEAPRWVWTPAIAPSGLLFYDGTAFQRWRGNLFSGAMAQRHLNRLALREGRVVLEERILDRIGGRVRTLAEGPDGAIYFANDDGKIVRLRPVR